MTGDRSNVNRAKSTGELCGTEGETLSSAQVVVMVVLVVLVDRLPRTLHPAQNK